MYWTLFGNAAVYVSGNDMCANMFDIVVALKLVAELDEVPVTKIVK